MSDALTKAQEDYLEALCELSGSERLPVRSIDLAEKLAVSRPSVNNAISVLKKNGFVTQEPYGAIVLTDEGFSYGNEIASRHRALYLFLHEILGVDSDTALQEACEIEHTICQDTMNKWKTYIRTALETDEK